MPEPVCVLHSTESPTFQAARNMLDDKPGIQPHWLIDPRTDEEHQYVAWPRPSKSLRNQPGGVETNNRPGGVLQVEIVGYAADMGRKAESWYQSLANMLRPKLQAAGIALELYLPFVPSPLPKGERPHLTMAQWLGAHGILGHQRVPENDHTDPGDLNRLEKYLNPPPEEETTMLKGLTALGNAMASTEELYLHHRGQLMGQDERVAWRAEFVKRAAAGEDLEPTLAYINWSLGQGR